MNNSAFVACIPLAPNSPPAWLRTLTEDMEAKQGLGRLVDRPGLVMLGDTAAAHFELSGKRGVLWGHVFNRQDYSRIAEAQGDALAGAPVDLLLQRCWGGYVAVRELEDGVEVLRDPSGTVACYHLEHDNVHIVTSRPDLLFDHLPIVPTIDWTVIAQSLAYRDMRSARTALRGISEILPGVTLTIQTGRTHIRCVWSPWTFADPAMQFADSNVATGELRETASRVLRAWGDCFEHPLVEISGGLDSAIVAAGLSRAAGAHCLTFGPAPGDANELPWARAVASHLGLSLTEMVADFTTVDIGQSDAWRQPRPCARTLSKAFDRPIQALARERDSDAFFGGAGGDSVFCLLNSALPVLDRLRAEGFGKGVLETAADIARLSRTNVWGVLLTALRRSVRRAGSMPSPMTNPFLATTARETLPWPADNPWLEAPEGVAPGKRRHVWSITAIQNHLEGYGREGLAPYLAPLMAQPILETCVRIPSWYWCLGGDNRAIAREAFRGILPDSVIDRRTKVSFNALVHRVIRANLPALREMLLDGALARHHLIDRDLVELYLGGRAKVDLLPELMALVDVEAWVSHWQSRSVNSACGR
jgi:asparagine synthase (glutamine-hydrolysing)